MNIARMYRHFLILLSLVVWGCASQPVKTIDTDQRAATKNKVLIATQKTKFKQAVVSEIYDELKRNSINMRIVDVKNLKSQSAGEFSAVVIISKSMAGRPDPRVESFIDRYPQKDKFIVLTTGIGGGWKPDNPGVDAITSASAMNHHDRIARAIVNKVLVLVNSRNPKP